MNDTIRATRVCMFCGGEARVLVPDGSDELDVDAAFSSDARFFSDVEDGDPIGVGCYRCSRKVRASAALAVPYNPASLADGDYR